MAMKAMQEREVLPAKCAQGREESAEKLFVCFACLAGWFFKMNPVVIESFVAQTTGLLSPATAWALEAGWQIPQRVPRERCRQMCMQGGGSARKSSRQESVGAIASST